MLALAARLLADTWVVDDLGLLPEDFNGTAVTRAGRVWSAALGELRQVPSGGRERALEQRNRRELLVAETEQAAQREQAALALATRAAAEVAGAQDAREAADTRLRAADRGHAEALEAERRFAWLIEQRRAAPDQGETAVRRAQLEGERAAERRAVERIEQQRRARDQRLAALEAQSRSDAELAPGAARLAAVLEGARRGARERCLARSRRSCAPTAPPAMRWPVPCANAPARRAAFRRACASSPTR